jgi:uncharacterized protein involved in type VI secretion and phage assembly
MGQELDLLGMLQGRVSTIEDEVEATQQRIYGVTLAEVTDLDDPKQLGRVKVRFPWLSSRVESGWARIATGWAGGMRGSYLLPEVGDEVVVAFRHGDLRHPYILGFLWSDTERPPQPSPRLERSELRSRSGHRVVFDDLVGKRSLTLISQSGHQILLDDSAGGSKISVTDSSGTVGIVLDTRAGKIAISSKTGAIELSATAGSISLDANSIDIHAKGALTLTGEGSVVVKGTTVRIN